MKMLAAVDGTVHSNDAVKYLVEHVRWYRETPVVELLYVNVPLPQLPYKSLTAAEITAHYAEQGRTALAHAKNTLAAAGIAFNEHMLVGPVAETIVKHARHTGCDIILLGTRGLGADGNVLLGSTATNVLYFSPLPVFVVKSQGPC
jgi:nucleotide-binding universal stress UspA family protein